MNIVTTRTAVLELVLAGLLWGFGFVAAVWALRETGPFALTCLRFALALTVLLPLTLSQKRWRRHLTRDQARLAFLPGLFLALTLLFQTWGLQYTTATKSSFITTLYVLMVPLLESWLLRRPLHRLHWLFVALALIGTSFICEFEGGDWNRGDLLTFACAIAASFQILWFGRISQRIGSAMTFNFWQTAWGLALSLPALLFEPAAVLPTHALPWVGVFSLAFGSTVIAFALQIRAQHVLAPSVAALIYLLESPFATLFAIALLNEALSVTQWLGGALILVSVAAATWLSMKPIGHVDQLADRPADRPVDRSSDQPIDEPVDPLTGQSTDTP